MKLEQRDIVLIPVPFTDLSSTKRRPVLVLSSTQHNNHSADILVAAITSNLTVASLGVEINVSDLDAGTLPLQSLIRADKLYTLSNSIVVKRYGKLNLTKFEETLKVLDDVLGRKASS